MKDNYSIGNKIKEYRCARGFSQEELAFRAGISTVYLRQIEKNIKNPTISTVFKLCNGLAIQPAALFEKEIPSTISNVEQQILALLSDKTESEKKIILELAKTAFKLRK